MARLTSSSATTKKPRKPRKPRKPKTPPLPPLSEPIPEPIKIEVPKLQTEGLRQAYEWVPINRLLGLELALAWYTENITTLLFGDPLSEERQHWYDKGSKAKMLGDSSSLNGEKEQAWITALHMWEKVWTGKSLPTVDAALTASPKPRVVQTQAVIESLNQAFAPFGKLFQITQKTEREFDGTTILIPQAEVNHMLGQSLLRTVLNEVVPVTKILSLVMAADGQTSLSGTNFMSNLSTVISRVTEWAEAAEKVIKKIGTAPSSNRSKSSTLATPMSQRIRIPAQDPFGIFKPDTIKAAIAQTLSDHQFKTLASLTALCRTYGVSAGMVRAAINGLQQKASDKVSIEFSADKKSIRIRP